MRFGVEYDKVDIKKASVKKDFSPAERYEE